MQARINTSASITLNNLQPGELAAITIKLHSAHKPFPAVVALASDYTGKPYRLGQPMDRITLVVIGVEKGCPAQLKTGMIITASADERVTPVAAVEPPSFVATYEGGAS